MNYIIIYLEVKHLLNFLTREQKGRLLEVLIEYGETNSLPECDESVLNVFNFLKPRIDAQRAKAELKAEIARKNGSTGGRPPKDKKPKKTQSKPKETQLVFDLPNFIKKDLWDSFVEMREQKKKPLTERAIGLMLADLQKFENKQTGFANLALENSIKNSWQGVFEPRNDKQQPQQTKSLFNPADWQHIKKS